jgi:hypothetical protein
MAIKSISELLQEVSVMRSRQDKLDTLRAHRTFALDIILQYTYHPDAIMDLPESRPYFKPTDADNHGVLHREARKLNMFLKGYNKAPPEGDTPEYRRYRNRLENAFIQMLEQVTPGDAEVLLGIKDKKLPYKGLAYDLIQEAFPDLLPEKTKKGTEKSEEV